MSTVLAIGLILPLLGAAAAITDRRNSSITGRGAGRRVALGAALLTGLAWAGLAAADTPPNVGRLESDPLSSAAVAGFALLVAARLPRAPLAAMSASCGVTVVAVAATAGAGDGSDRPLAVGVAVVLLVATLRLWAGAASRATVLSLGGAGALVTVGLLVDGAEAGAVVVLAGVGLGIAVAAVASTAVLLIPVFLLVTARSVGPLDATGAGGSDAVGITGAVVVLTAAGVLLLIEHHGRRRRITGPILVVTVALAAVALLSLDVSDLRTSGTLLAAGAVLAAATRRPLGLVACLPGLVAAVEAFGSATGPVHAAAGAVVALAVGRAVLARVGPQERQAWTLADDWPVVPAVAFAVLPAWGWTGADLAAYREGIATAGAAALLAAAGILLAGVAANDVRRPLGRLLRRRPTAIHGSTNPQVEAAGPVEGDRPDAPEVHDRDVDVVAPGQPARDPIGAAQRPVAGAAGTVPRRPVAGGARGGSRLRARPGRAAR